MRSLSSRLVPVAVAAMRVAEQRIRASRTLRHAARKTLAALCQLSPEARAFVRLRLMPMV